MSANSDTPLWRRGAVDLAAGIRRKEFSCREVVQAHLDRISAVNADVNAITMVLSESVLQAAERADKVIASGDQIGPLHGVPFTIKENIDLVGTPTTHGVVDLKNSMPEADAPVITHLKRAGAIPIGRTNLPDFGLRWHTDNDLHGPTRNPWDPTRTPGGSSGGEAAAIATGLSPLGVGNDMGGSIRYPAQCCGITGLRPSLGRVSRIVSSIFPDDPTFYPQIASVNGPMARHVGDLRLALDVMSQADPRDPWWTPAVWGGHAGSEPIRIAVTGRTAGPSVDPTVAAGVETAAAVLADHGYEVEDARPPRLDEATQIIEQLLCVEIMRDLPRIRPLISHDVRAFLERLIEDVDVDTPSYVAAIAKRHGLARHWNMFFERYPLILGPVSTLPPPKVGFDTGGAEQMDHFTRSVRLTETCNLLGLPSVAVPVGVADGLPQGVQLIAARFHEDSCLDAAEIIERALGVLTPIEPCAAAVA